MRFRFNPYRLLFPVVDASPANAPPEGESNLQGDHSASTFTSVDALAGNASQLASQVDVSSAPTPSPAVKEGLKLLPITIPIARLQSLQLPPSQILATIGTDIGKVTHVATTSKDSTFERVVFGSGDGKLFFFQPITPERDEANSNNSDSPPSLAVPFQGPECYVTSLVFSSDNTKLLVSWYDGKVMAFDAKDGSILYECQAPDGLFDCAFSNDGKRVVIGGGDGWNMFDFNKFPSEIEYDELTSPPRRGRVNSVTFSDEDTKLAVGVVNGDAPGCYIYNNAKGNNKLLNTFRKGESVMKVAFSPNKMILAVGSFGKVHLFNVATGDCLHTRWWQGYTKVNGVRTTR